MIVRCLTVLAALSLIAVLQVPWKGPSVEIPSSRMQELRGGAAVAYGYCTTPAASSHCQDCKPGPGTSFMQCTTQGTLYSCVSTNGSTSLCTQCIISANIQCGGTYTVFTDAACTLGATPVNTACGRAYNASAGTKVLSGTCPNNCEPVVAIAPANPIPD